MARPPAVTYSPGQALAARFYRQVVAPLLGTNAHSAALLGEGSEVLGYDDAVSTDHDFGPRLQVFRAHDADPATVHDALARLPERFDGFPVAFARSDQPGARPRHQVTVTTAQDLFTSAIGVDPALGMNLADWLLTPTQRLASLTAGVVLHDPEGALARRRAALSWYPEDIWRYVLAAAWLRIGQEEAFIGRTGGAGDELGSAILAARLVRDLVRLAFLVERRWAPYGKWLGRAFSELPLAGEVGPPLRAALAATGWREREAALGVAASALGAATNRLGLAAGVDPSLRRFFTRDIQVVGAERFTEALTAAITDPEVRRLLDRLGHRGGGASVGVLPGALDQAVDSVEVLSQPGRCRAAAPCSGSRRLTSLHVVMQFVTCDGIHWVAMATITIRTDDAVDEALEALTAGRRSRSEAIREAILLAYREQRHARLRAEAQALRDDPEDVAASRQLAADMETLRAW